MAEKKAHKPKARANGEGTIFKRSSDNMWVGRIPNGHKPDGSIKYIQFTGKTQGAVKEKIDKAKAELRTLTYQEPSKVTLKDFITEWLNGTMKNSVQKSTWTNYDQIIKLHIIPAIGEIRLQKLQPSHIQGFYNDLLENGRRDKIKNPDTGEVELRKGGLSPGSVHIIHKILTIALSQAVLEKIIPFNILKDKAVRLPKDPKKEMKTLDISEIERFLVAAKASRYYPAFFLEIYTGLRRGELLGIRWKDVDLKNCTIKIVQQIIMVGSKVEVSELKTASSKRMIAIPDEVIKVLKEHKAKQEVELRHRGLNDLEIAEYFKTGLVFTASRGNAVHPRCLNTCFKIVLKSGKLKDVRLHDLRHSFALLSLQAGTDIKTLQNDLGHSSISTTLDIYGHVNEAMKRDASDKRSQLLKTVTTKSSQVQ